MWNQLRHRIQGDLFTDDLHRILYATDASVYRELPQAVVLPRSTEDILAVVDFCKENGLPIIPRATGTSLAGQVVGNGLVLDTSKYLRRILNLNSEERTVRVQPGVIRDELNQQIASSGLFFGPNTSTSNRATIGGMVGNNSCGSTSISYGHTRDKAISIEAVLSDAQLHEFGDVDLAKVVHESNRVGEIYQYFKSLLDVEGNRATIIDRFPKANIPRRNTGYALDALTAMQPWKNDGPSFNLAKLLCGSEGTLALTTEVTLSLDPLPPPHVGLMVLEFDTIRKSLESVQALMPFKPYQCELMDDAILECTVGHPVYGKYLRHFDTLPRGLILAEFRGHSEKGLLDQMKLIRSKVEAEVDTKKIHFLFGKEIEEMWSLRKAGLGLLANIPGDPKAVACVEDTAVALEDLPEYIDEFEAMMQEYGQKAIYYAHAGAGELHLRPVLDLKRSEDVKLFEEISSASADLVLKYNGSLSGEHGDGRVRAPFLERMVGPEVYGWLKEIKKVWDPEGLFNPGKIIDATAMTEDLRYAAERREPEYDTTLRFREEGGILRAAEKCNGSGDCRKTHHTGGVLCPSFHATLDEQHTTRGRANVLREVLTQKAEANAFRSPELKAALDLCLACKACASECPSKVNMAAMKATFLEEYYSRHRHPLRDFIFTKGMEVPPFIRPLVKIGTNLINTALGRPFKSLVGLHPDRPLPSPGAKVKAGRSIPSLERAGTPILLYVDEFTSAYDGHLVEKAVGVFERLGQKVVVSPLLNSARALISKGYLKKARQALDGQIEDIHGWVENGGVIVGVEPSAILGFRDEAHKLVSLKFEELAKTVKSSTYTFTEYLKILMENDQELKAAFVSETVEVHVHGHCHFKALADMDDLLFGLGCLPGVMVQKIDAGCCGMAGSFGYEKEHYEISQKIAHLQLIPHVRNTDPKVHIIAQGTSCRHQIKDFSGRQALHPIDFVSSRLK
jgi:FAD/FMN-containing dehydrogenase/Fe-S oxidoreductase